MSGIESIMNRDVVSIGRDSTVANAARLMRAHRLGALVVVDTDQIYGMLSERDLVYRVIADGLDPETTAVGQVLTLDPVTALENDSVDACFRILREQGFRHLPVRDEEHRPVGIVSSRDFMWGILMGAEPDVDIEAVCRKLGALGQVMKTAQERYPAFD